MNRGRLIQEEYNFFEIMCNELGVRGQYAHDNDGLEYMVIVAPNGAIRAVPCRVEWLDFLTDGLDRSEAIYEIRRDLLTKFMSGGCGVDTSPMELTYKDRKFFNKFRQGVLELMGRI